MIVYVNLDADDVVDSVMGPAAPTDPGYKRLDIPEDVLRDFVMGSAGGRHTAKQQRRLDECSDLIRAAYKAAP